ncbi:latexin [Thalassophryne amazonica]|uniref:latexin n=1 Tax=Thalassophryne amazonica TaxID=390379 RepID=UPI001470F16C|nr:latexin [Thalassophryne amazonica]
MSLEMIILLAVLAGVPGDTNAAVTPDADAAELSAEGSSISGQPGLLLEDMAEKVMATGKLNPNFYPAQRAAMVVQHFLNSRYGSPYKWFGLQKVHRANAMDVADNERKYEVEIQVQEAISNMTETCSAKVVFFTGPEQKPPQVHASCDDLAKINTTAQEEALYQHYMANDGLLSAQYLPDSYGHIDPDMKPLWHLGAVASSFVMLNESTENTLYNFAQVANVTQLKAENDDLKFDYHVLLHDMVSQEIIHWKLLVTWSPGEGVNVLKTEKLPHCQHCD